MASGLLDACPSARFANILQIAPIRSAIMKKCTVLANEVLAYTYFVYHAVMVLISGFIWLYEPLGVWIMLLAISSVVVSCCITERWCLMLTFDRDGVLYKPLFRKGMRIQYSNYPRIQYAYYMHGNMFAAYKVNFFVFTNRRLSNEELTQINQVAPSSDLIKIRYTRKTYKKLLEALPPSIALEVKQIHDVYIKK